MLCPVQHEEPLPIQIHPHGKVRRVCRDGCTDPEVEPMLLGLSTWCISVHFIWAACVQLGTSRKTKQLFTLYRADHPCEWTLNARYYLYCILVLVQRRGVVISQSPQIQGILWMVAVLSEWPVGHWKIVVPGYCSSFHRLGWPQEWWQCWVSDQWGTGRSFCQAAVPPFTNWGRSKTTWAQGLNGAGH